MACNDSSGSNESGSFSYDVSVNGCETKQSFNGKSNYCEGLKDQELNHDCALSDRKAMFESADCAGGFQPTRMTSFQVWGYDPVVHRSCSVGENTGRFAQLADYCGYLSNESIHQGCFWKDRKAEFESWSCAGSFPAAPQPGPGPSPVPSPTVGPSPTPSPTGAPVDLRPQVIKDLEAAGIKVEIRDDGFPHVPGEPDFGESFAQFLVSLENLKAQLIARASILKHLTITEYTTYRANDKDLSVGVNLSQAELEQYLGLLDRRVAWERSTGIELDLGVEIYGFESGDKTAALRQEIQALESRRDSLAALSGAFQKIAVKDYDYYYVFASELGLSAKQFAADLDKYLQAFSPTSGFFQWVKSRKIKISGNFDVNKDLAGFVGFVSALDSDRAALEDLVAYGKLDEIVFDIGTLNYFYGALHPAYSGEGRKVLSQVLHALQYQFVSAFQMKIEIKNGMSDIGASYLTAIQRMQANDALIRRKLGSIRSIYLGGTSSSFSSGMLQIGTTDTPTHLAEILKAIP